jgi:anaphase-promoting complex subunit 10
MSAAQNHGAAAAENNPYNSVDFGKLRELGGSAVWSVSSFKRMPKTGIGAFGPCGVEQLKDNRPDTYWESDGSLPHRINIHLQRRMILADVSIYLDYKADENYTPKKISIRVGSDFHDLEEVERVSPDKPNGWVRIPLKNVNDPNKTVRGSLVQIVVLSNHGQGRQSRIRQVRVHAPPSSRCKSIHDDMPEFTSKEFLSFLYCR